MCRPTVYVYSKHVYRITGNSVDMFTVYVYCRPTHGVDSHFPPRNSHTTHCLVVASQAYQNGITVLPTIIFCKQR